MWKVQDWSPTQVVREINFSHLEAPKTDILTILAARNLNFWEFLTFSSVKFF